MVESLALLSRLPEGYSNDRMGSLSDMWEKVTCDDGREFLLDAHKGPEQSSISFSVWRPSRTIGAFGRASFMKLEYSETGKDSTIWFMTGEHDTLVKITKSASGVTFLVANKTKTPEFRVQGTVEENGAVQVEDAKNETKTSEVKEVLEQTLELTREFFEEAQKHYPNFPNPF